MTALLALAHLAAVGALALVVPGVVTRTKSWWSGRRGAPVLQLARDLARLLRKTPVYSEVTTPVFRLAPWVALAAAVAAAGVAPIAGLASPLAFSGDFLFFAYVAGLGRAARNLAALDTGSPFEGMGASRDATFGALLEPALVAAFGAGILASGADTLSGLLLAHPRDVAGLLVHLGMAAALAVAVTVEAGRLPVDDPTTHLELTMIHEVTVLDHSGPDLAALQLASGLHLATGLALLVALLLPPGLPPAAAPVAAVAGTLLAAVALGTAESLVARLRLGLVPSWIALGTSAAALAVVATLWVRR